MCGILGVFNGAKSWQQAKGVNNFMKQGCVAGLFRGEDSTGLMQLMHSGSIRVRRSILNGYDFAQMKRIDSILESSDTTRATIIHHRKATMGSVVIENCHPFEHETPEGRYVCGVHNGTIPEAPSKEDGLTFDVDSDWLYYKIAKEGAAKALGLIQYGAYALVWHEQEGDRKRFYIACNGERPLHWAYVKSENIMLIASEDSMLYWLADRNGLEIEEMFTPKKDVIYEFDTEGDLRQYVSIKIEKAEKPLVALPRYDRPGQGGWDRDSNSFVRVANVADASYRDFHGPEGLVDTPFSMGMEVDFVFQRAIKNKSNESHWEARGEVIIDVAGVPQVWNACIQLVDKIQLDNIQRADSCWVKTYGVRHEVSNKTGLIEIMLLVSPPSVIQIDGDDEGPKVGPEMTSLEDLYGVEPEVPWDSSGLDDALDNIMSGATRKGPGGKYISMAKWRELIKDGCAGCPASIIEEMSDEIGWYSADGGPLCPDCVDGFFNSMRSG